MARKWPDWVYMYYLEFVITLSWVIPVILYIYIARSDNLAHAGSKENNHINFATRKNNMYAFSKELAQDCMGNARGLLCGYV